MVCGIILSGYIPYHGANLIVFFSLVLLFLCVKAFQQQKNQNSSKSLAIFAVIVFIAAGAQYASIYRQQLFDQNLPQKAKYIGTIEEKNINEKKRVRFQIKIDAAQTNDTTFKVNESIIVFSSDSAINHSIYPGQVVAFDAQLFEINTNNNPGEFNYRRFMHQKGIRYQAFVRSNVVLLDYNKHTLKTYALTIRSELLALYKKHGIENDEFAVLAALTLGEKSYLSSTIRNSFSASGAMHVLAVSGLHVGIIFMIMNIMLNQLGSSKYARITKVVIALLLLWGYAFITGLSPSVLRACTMFSFVVIGSNLNRKTNIYNTLAVSAFVLILINPQIINEVGFQLSYSAVIAIVFFQPKIVNIIVLKNRVLKYLWELFAVSVAAQIGTFAISIYYFHQFPVYFWISNFIVIPAAGIILYCAVLFFITSFLPWLPLFFAFVLNTVIKFMNSGISFIEKMPGSVAKQLWMNDFTLIALIIIIVSMAWFIEKKRYQQLIFSLLLLTITCANMLIQTIKIHNQSIIIFYNNYSAPLVSFIDGTLHYYYTPNDSLDQNSIQLLQNSTGVFRTDEAQTLSVVGDKNKLAKHEHVILYKFLAIELINQSNLSKKELMHHDIRWQIDQRIIEVKKSDFYKTQSSKALEDDDIQASPEIEVFNTKKDGALLVIM